MADRPVPAVTPIERDPAKLAEALPWYLNGTLSAEDRAWVEARLAEDPVAAEQAGFDRLVRSELAARVAEVPAGIGWETLLAKARTEAGPARTGSSAGAGAGAAGAGAAVTGAGAGAGPVTPRAAPAGRTASPSEPGGLSAFVARLVDWIGGAMTPRLATGLAALVIAQTVALGVLLGGRGDGDTVEYRSGPGAAPVATLRVLLKDTVTESALREALLARRVTIIDGPNDLGEYWLLPADGAPEAVGKALADTGIVATWSVDHRPRVR